MSDEFVGVRVDGGTAPFQVVQQDTSGMGRMAFRGRWRHAENRGAVQLRLVREADGAVVSPATNWQAAREQDGTAWAHTFDRVPAGGLYRLETRLMLDPNGAEWSPHGNTVHHLGVGDLWIIAGQSNAAGYGRGPTFDPPELGVHILKNDETWDIAAHPLNDTTRSSHPNLEQANPSHSPYLRFAKDLHAALGYPIALVQTALGGSPLSAWNPEENPDAPLYKNLMHCVTLAGGRVRGMVWYQGESDCGPQLAPTYEHRFEQFIRRLRRDLDAPTLPVIVAQLNRYTGQQDLDGERGWSIIREAQRRAVALGHVAVVPTLDLPISDLIHTSSDGNLLLGLRKARAALAVAYGRPVDWQAPEVTTGQLMDGGNAIELSFTGVSNRLAFLGPGEKDFVVEDAAGFVPIKAASCPGRDRVRLELAHPAVRPVSVHGAFGAFPPATLRDAETNEPMLGFYGLEVTE
ncbi:MAG: hypothetical protein HY710_11570 [Candidatus Latescibacteria bacterium]|nr:hypothetical protein [Candidatus Latescibacterota bacterium]